MVEKIELNSPIEKIVKLRKKYKLTQKDLVGEELARSTLAMIETKKVNLTENVAKVIVKNFNKIFEARGINHRVEYDYIMEDMGKQARVAVEKQLNELSGLGEFYKVRRSLDLFFLKEWFPEEEVLAYKRLSEEAKMLDLQEETYTLKKALIEAYVKLEEYHNAFDVFERLLIYGDKLMKHRELWSLFLILEGYLKNISSKNRIYLRFANYFYKSSCYEEAIYCYNEVESKKMDISITRKLLKEKAECLVNIGDFEEALKIYRKLSRINCINTKFVVHLALAKLYSKRSSSGDYDKVKRYFWKLRTLAEDIRDRDFFADKKGDMATIANYLNSEKKAYEYYLDVIKNWQEGYSKSTLLKAFDYLLKNSDQSRKKVVEEVEEYYYTLLEKDNSYLKLAFSFIDYYRKYEYFENEKKILLYMV